MKITGIETFVVDTGFAPPRPWLFCALRTDEGLTGSSEFGCQSPNLCASLSTVKIMERGRSTELNEKAAREHARAG